MGFGEVCVKKPACGCFSLKGSALRDENGVRIRIAPSEEHVHTGKNFCRVWLHEKTAREGKGHLKFTFSFQSHAHTKPLSIRILKITPIAERRPPSQDSIDCRIYVSYRDFRTLQEINSSFVNKVEKLLSDVEQHDAFASRTDLIKQKLDNYALAIFPHSEGFVLFKEHQGLSRPEHVLLRIRPSAIELCLPQYRSPFPTFSSERHSVTSLQEALMEFTRLPSWPVVRRGQFGIDWARDRSTSQPRLETATIEHQWEGDDAGLRDAESSFLDDTVQNFHTTLNAEKEKRVLDATHWKVGSVKSLVQDATCISLHENVSLYLAIEKATLAILSHCEAAAETFVESVAAMIRKHGSKSLGIYKLLAAAVDLPDVKKAMLRLDLLNMLQEQYELMTQIFACSSSSESNESQCSVRDEHLEVNKMQYFTFPQTVDSERSQVAERRLSESITAQTDVSRSVSHSLHRTARVVSNEMVISSQAASLPDSCLTHSSVACQTTTPSSKEQAQQQNIPKLTFYWLSQHDRLRSTNSEATHTTISFPDGRSIVLDEDLRTNEVVQILPKGSHPRESVSLLRSRNSSYSSNSGLLSFPSVIESTLHAWGVRLDESALEDPDIPLYFAIKCTILEIMCAFSRLNLDSEINEECIDSVDSKTPNDMYPHTEMQHLAYLVVHELLASRWQVFPGEQPSIRWGPLERGTHVALALMHEFACLPLNEAESSKGALSNMRLLKPQDLQTESYLLLLTEAKHRLTQILQFQRIDTYTLEEARSVIQVLGDFVTSSPTSDPAQLVAYTCWNTFLPLEATIFKACEVNKWPVAIFRLFHALLRLFKCMLERSGDVLLEEFLISSLLKRESWTKMVRDYSRAVLFSEKLERKYDPDELHCLRSELWDYYTAVVTVVRAQRKGSGLEHDNLPRDFNDVRPPLFGQDPLDFLRYLVIPEEGHAPRALQRRYWGQTHHKDSADGGIHERVLLFLKALFSIPNNGFLKERDISNYYLELHWNGFKQSYMAAAFDKSLSSAVVCRLHLEVIRMIMGHHYVEIFSQAVRLGIMNCLADEIALEHCRSSTFGAPTVPTSQLSKAMSESPGTPMHAPTGEGSLSGVADARMHQESALSSTDAESGLLSSIEFTSEGLTTTTSQPGSPALKSRVAFEDSRESEILQSISFRDQGSPRTECSDCHRAQESTLSTPSLSKDEQVRVRGRDRSNPVGKNSTRSGETPSRIPVCGNRKSVTKTQGGLHRQAQSFSLNPRAEALKTTGSLVFPAFETRIPCPPPASGKLSFDSITLDSMQSRGESSRMSGGLRTLSNLFSRKPTESPRPERPRRRRQTSLCGHVRSAREKLSSKLKQASCKTPLPGLSPPAKLTSVKKISPKQATTSGQKCFDNEIKRALRKKSSCGIQATISYSPTRLHIAGLSVDSGSLSAEDALKSRSSTQPSGKEKIRSIPLLNLKDINSPRKTPGIGHNLVHVMGRVSATSKKTISRKLDNEDYEPEGSPSHKFNSESKTPASITSQVASHPGCMSSDTPTNSQSFDEYCDWHAPPTFGIYCEHRVDHRTTAACAGDPDNSLHDCPIVLESQAPSSAQSPNALQSSSVIEAASSTDSHCMSRFETPSDFEYTGDAADDCRRLEMLEREFYGLSSSDTSTTVDCSSNQPAARPVRIRPPGVPSLRISDQSRANEQTVHVGDVYLHSSENVATSEMPPPSADSGTCLALGTVFSDPRLQLARLSSESSHPPVPPLFSLAGETSKSFWERESPALSGFKTPSDFEYTGDVEEDVKKLEQLERMHHGISSPSSPSSELDDAASTLDSQFSPHSSVCDPLPVPKLNLHDGQTSSGARAIRGLGALFLGEQENSVGHSQGDALSSFSWMNLSANESVSESEFSALLEGTAKMNERSATLNPYDVAKAERYVYSDVALRCIWVELLLEGMLLEYSTRPARDHDTYLPDIERIIKYLPKVLLHHLDDEISDPVVAQLNKKLSVQSPNIHRLLRLLSGSLFSAELYSKKDHIARGTFAHVFRCSLPLEDGPESCILKVVDHPVEQNEMSTLMDTYSEISVMEQFRGNSHVSHLYDYGVSSGSIFIVMQDYKCSLLEWRQRFPEQSPGALRLFLRIFQNIIDAVKVLHDQNVVHFDLKCSNILLEPLPGISEEHFWNPPTEEPPFRVIIADFGEARSYSNDWEARTVRNRGTEFNKSPEMLLIAKAQQTDGPEYDRRKRIGAGPPSDVWALGCLLFELFTGEFLQFDTDWFRFFLRVTTNTMPVIDGEKQRMLTSVGHSVVCGLLEFILVREHLWRPNLASLRQKVDSFISGGEFPRYIAPVSLRSLPLRAVQKVPKRPAMSLLGTFHLPREKVVSFTPSVKLARLECLHNPWILSENNISLVVCIKGSAQPSANNLNSTASRANVRVLEISLGDEESVCQGHADSIIDTGPSGCICVTCQEGFESDALELVLKTLHSIRPSSSYFGNLMDLRRSLKTF